jgi:hypothetical protein
MSSSRAVSSSASRCVAQLDFMLSRYIVTWCTRWCLRNTTLFSLRWLRCNPGRTIGSMSSSRAVSSSASRCVAQLDFRVKAMRSGICPCKDKRINFLTGRACAKVIQSTSSRLPQLHRGTWQCIGIEAQGC